MKKCNLLISVFIGVLLLWGCSNESQFDNDSNINVFWVTGGDNVQGYMDSIVLLGTDIVWFNQKTGELKLQNNSRTRSFPASGKILFMLANMELFMATVINSTDLPETIYEDMVLYVDKGKNTFHLYTSYPVGVSTPKVLLNNDIRYENWNLFLLQLNREGRLK